MARETWHAMLIRTSSPRPDSASEGCPQGPLTAVVFIIQVDGWPNHGRYTPEYLRLVPVIAAVRHPITSPRRSPSPYPIVDRIGCNSPTPDRLSVESPRT